MSEKNVERMRGNRLGFWFFRTAARLFGLRGAYGLLYFVCLYYLLFDRSAVLASMAFVERRFPGHGVVRRLIDVYLLFVSQGRCLIDRYYVVAGGNDIRLELVGDEKIRTYLAREQRGMILLTAHVGNWQVSSTALKNLGRTVHLMMRPEDNAAVKETLGIDAERGAVRVLFTDGMLGGVVDALRAISRGDIVSIMGDRAYEYESIEVPLLGGNVRFPHGAFTLAAAARCPVAVLLSARVGMKQYLTDVSHFIDPPPAGRAERQSVIGDGVREFARALEEFAERYPYQWFVFRDMWHGNN